jgi:hypothetical protein
MSNPKIMSAGSRSAIPVVLFLLVGFAAPLLAVIWFSFMPPRSFSFGGVPTLENYRTIFGSTIYISFLWSLALAVATVVLALICYPVAYGLVRVFGKWAMLVMLLFTIPLFVSENIRLYGWVLFLIKNGVLLGTLKSWFGVELESMLFSASRHHARHGLCLSALHAVPDDARHLHGAERDAGRGLRPGRLALAGVQGGGAAALHARHRDRLPPDIRAGDRRHRRGQGAGRAKRHPGDPRHRDRLHLFAELAAGCGHGRAADAGRGRSRGAGARRFDLDTFLGRR